jgi:hypothetical protein
MIVATIVVVRNAGWKSSPTLGRFKVPCWRFSFQIGDSGRNGRMMINGIAGIRPEINVYRQASCPP